MKKPAWLLARWLGTLLDFNQLLRRLFRAGDGERQHAFSRNSDFFLACSGCHSSTGSGASRSTDCCTFATSRQPSNQCAGRRSATNLGDIALGVTLAFTADA